jgi:hypothetical protein
MQTNSGIAFWPLDPKIEEISLDDIAHALSQANRYGGHCKFPYSVAQHSVLLFDWLLACEPSAHPGAPFPNGQHVLQWAILHDAPEFVFQDIIGPIKRTMKTGDYKLYYNRLEFLISVKFGLSNDMPGIIDLADKRIVLDEQAALMAHPSPLEWSFYRGLEPLGVTIEEWDWRKAKAEFLGRCDAVGLR